MRKSAKNIVCTQCYGFLRICLTNLFKTILKCNSMVLNEKLADPTSSSTEIHVRKQPPGKNKLRTYNLIKTKYAIEPYLLCVANKGKRQSMSKLKCSNHSLAIETKRHKKIKVDNRFWWITYMLGLVDSFSDKWLAFLWEQTVPHYWLTCFSISMKMSFWINSLRKAKESLLESSIHHTVTSMTLSLLIIKDLRSSFPIFTQRTHNF